MKRIVPLMMLMLATLCANAQTLPTIGSTSAVARGTSIFGAGWPDGSLNALKNGSIFYVFASRGATTGPIGALTSPDLNDLASNYSIYNIATNISHGLASSWDEDYHGGGPVYYDSVSGELIMMTHGEYWFNGDWHTFYSSLGIAYSSDFGVHWTVLGEVISPQWARSNGYGSIAIGSGTLLDKGDGYLYAYYTDVPSCMAMQNCEYDLAVARVSLADLRTAMATGTYSNSLFKKYFNGSYSQPGVNDLARPENGGGFTPILTCGNYSRCWIQEPQVKYDTYANEYVLVYMNGDNGISVSVSMDGINWGGTATAPIIDTTNSVPVYPSLLRTDGGDPNALRQSFYLYYTQPLSGLFGGAYLERTNLYFPQQQATPIIAASCSTQDAQSLLNHVTAFTAQADIPGGDLPLVAGADGPECDMR